MMSQKVKENDSLIKGHQPARLKRHQCKLLNDMMKHNKNQWKQQAICPVFKRKHLYASRKTFVQQHASKEMLRLIWTTIWSLVNNNSTNLSIYFFFEQHNYLPILKSVLIYRSTPHNSKIHILHLVKVTPWRWWTTQILLIPDLQIIFSSKLLLVET